MPLVPLLLQALGSPLGKIMLGGLAVLTAAAGALWFVHHERQLGEAKCEAAVTAAKDAEQAREAKINDDWRQWADGANQNADIDHARINALQKQYATASAANNARQCLDADTAQRVRSIGGRGAAEPGTRPAGPQR